MKSFTEYNRKNLSRAISLLSYYLEKNPDQPNAYTSLGNVYKKTGKLEKAKEYYLKALEKVKDLPFTSQKWHKDNLERINKKLEKNREN